MSTRPWQLDDRAWLQRRYLLEGDMSIALDLHVSRGSVIRARERLRIPSSPVGRRRGSLQLTPAAGQDDSIASMTLTGTPLAILTRLAEDQKTYGGASAPTEALLARRVTAVAEASRAGDQLAYEDALLAVASMAGLIHQHQQRLRN